MNGVTGTRSSATLQGQSGEGYNGPIVEYRFNSGKYWYRLEDLELGGGISAALFDTMVQTVTFTS